MHGPPARARLRHGIAGRSFGLLVAVFAFTAAFHGAAVLAPSLAPSSSAFRPALFVVVNAVVAVGLLRRPPWFVWPFSILTAQQLYSHGRDLWLTWSGEGRVDWMSLAVLAVMPLTLAMLVR